MEPQTTHFRATFAGLLLAMLLGVARPDDRGHGAADDRRATSAGSTSSPGSSPPTSSAPPSRCRCGARVSDLYGRKTLFLAAIVVFLAGSALSRRRPDAGAADRLPRAAGPRRRRPDDARDGDRRRHRLAARARPLPGLHPDGLRRSPASPGRCSAALFADHCPGAGSSTSTCRSAPPRLTLVASALHLPVEREPRRVDYARRRAARRRADVRAARHGLGRRPVRVDSAQIVGLAVGARAARRVRRAGAPRRRSRSCRCGCSATASSTSSRRALFLTTLRVLRGDRVHAGVPADRRPARARPCPACCCCRCCSARTASTIVSGRAISRTGRYKRFPVVGLAMMAVGLVAARHARRGRARRRTSLALPGAVRPRLRAGHPGPDRRDPERGRPARPRHRDRVGEPVPLARRRGRRRRLRRDLRQRSTGVSCTRAGADAARAATVFLAAAPVAALGALVV